MRQVYNPVLISVAAGIAGSNQSEANYHSRQYTENVQRMFASVVLWTNLCCYHEHLLILRIHNYSV